MTERSRFHGIRYVGDFLLWRLMSRIGVLRFRADEAVLVNVDEFVDFAYSWRFPRSERLGDLAKNGFEFNIKPFQVREEILSLLRVIAPTHPKFLLEIGTFTGGTAYLFLKVAAPDATMITLDLPRRFPSLARSGQRILPLLMNAHDSQTQSLVQALLNNHRLDFLFIDGDHSLEWIRRDFEMYGPFVRRGGIIAFHDIAKVGPECKVKKLWEEIRESYQWSEIVADKNEEWGGIGVIHR